MSSKKTIILTIDGGGIKGIIPSYILGYIENLLNKQSFQLFDIIGGTSTGGIIACALTAPSLKNASLPFNAQDILDIYQNHGSDIFVKQGEGLLDAEYYSNDLKGNGIEPYLQSLFNNQTLKDNSFFISQLKDSRTKQVFTTSYIVNSTGGKIENPIQGNDYGPILFNWFDSNQSRILNYFVWEAVRATSAAPTYFPIAHIGGNQMPRSNALEKWALDGGTMSNNPAVWAIAEAFRTRLASKLEDIILISIGTGKCIANSGVGITNEGYTVPSNGNWGTTPWLGDKLYNLSEKEFDRGVILDMVLNASQLISNQQLESFKLAGLQYFRLEPEITIEQSQMDNISKENIDSLFKIAKIYVANNHSLISEITTLLETS